MTNDISYRIEPKVKIRLSPSSTPMHAIVVRFLDGKAEPQFGEVGLMPGSLFFESGGLEAGVLKVSTGDPAKSDPESYRVAAAAAVKWLRANHAAAASFDLMPVPPMAVMQTIPAVVEGLILGDYQFEAYKTARKERSELKIELLISAAGKFEHLASRAQIIARAVCLARDWSHEPANSINPATLSEWSRKLAEEHSLLFKELDDKALEELGAGALLAVGKGSATPARLIILEYPGKNPENSDSPIVLVGKAITFDTGGYSIKTVDSIKGMKFDKSGGIDVIAAVVAASELQLEQRVVAIVGAAENSIASDSYKPDDILKTLSGKTVEVATTDAEGRLVLADCLTYAQNEYSPRVIIDVATLTSAIVTALGRVRAGLFSNDDTLAEALLDSASRTHELLWRMPIDDEYLAGIRSDEADIKNAGIKEGQSIVAAVFLKQFVRPEVPWAHLDIDGTATIANEAPYCPKGATGFGVRLLLDYISRL